MKLNNYKIILILKKPLELLVFNYKHLKNINKFKIHHYKKNKENILQ